ncbi:MAG: carbon-nitrogen hydrolase [Candidatus Melainabacteria bacterium]|nr:MAG: carbon-nitrogen hydrolase [Candidatus Melainabacteria bacterium]
MKVAAAQLTFTSGDLVKNTNKMLEYVSAAAKNRADVVFFPEMSDTGYEIPVIRDKAQYWDRGTVPELCDTARANKINVIAGVSERTDGGIFNSIVVIDRYGKVVGKYRKTHLIKAKPFFEHECFTAGDSLDTFTVEGMNCGFMTCYDIRFPEVAGTLRNKGAEAIFVPAAFPLVRQTHWLALLTARAIENQVFMIGANRVGTDGEVTFAGTSTIIDPYGTILSSASAIHEGLISAEIGSELVEQIRSQFKVHEDRRPSLYRM